LENLVADPVNDPHENPPAFKVVDRRRFTPAGEVRPGGDAALHEDRRRPAPTLSPSPAAEPEAKPTAAVSGQRDASKRPQPPRRSQVDFLSFVASLATNAMAALGMMPEGQGPALPFNPPMAREYIEIIVMLEERTVGNLSDDEAESLARLIKDLRTNYLEATRPPQAPESR
jgi:hypothetical protein